MTSQILPAAAVWRAMTAVTCAQCRGPSKAPFTGFIGFIKMHTGTYEHNMHMESRWKHIKACWSTHSSVSKCILGRLAGFPWADFSISGAHRQGTVHVELFPGGFAPWIGDKSLQELSSVRLRVHPEPSETTPHEVNSEEKTVAAAELLCLIKWPSQLKNPKRASKGTFWFLLYSDSALSEEWTYGKTLKLDGTRMGWNVVPIYQQEKTWQQPLDCGKWVQCVTVSSLNPSSGDGLKATMAGKVSTLFPGISPVSWPIIGLSRNVMRCHEMSWAWWGWYQNIS